MLACLLEKVKGAHSKNSKPVFRVTTARRRLCRGVFRAKTRQFFHRLQPGNLDSQHRRGTSKTEPEATAQGQQRPGLACLIFDTESRGGRTAETAGGSAPKTQSRLFAQGRDEPGTAGGVSGAKRRGLSAPYTGIEARGKQEDRQPWHVKKTSRGRAVPGQIPVK